jgi:DNA mismatch repair ATPase MutS
LRQPLCDLVRVTQRYDVVEAFNEASECREALHKNFLRKVHDVVPLADKLTKGKTRLDECYKLSRSVRALESMIEQMAEVENCGAVQELLLV